LLYFTSSQQNNVKSVLNFCNDNTFLEGVPSALGVYSYHTLKSCSSILGHIVADIFKFVPEDDDQNLWHTIVRASVYDVT